VPLNQRGWIKQLEAEGWTRERGGKHVVKMTKEGQRPITLPASRAMIAMKTDQKQLHVDVHHEDGSYWAEVRELPGCFASGQTVAELIESVEEAVALYLAPEGQEPKRVPTELAGFELSIETDRPLQAA